MSEQVQPNRHTPWKHRHTHRQHNLVLKIVAVFTRMHAQPYFHTHTHTHASYTKWITAQLISLMESVCDVTLISTTVSLFMAVSVFLIDPFYDRWASDDIRYCGEVSY